MADLEDQVRRIVEDHRTKLALQIELRRKELIVDDDEHQQIYQVLGIPAEECPKIDLYQNIGRFVYKYAGALLEDTTALLLSAAGGGGALVIPNTVSRDPLNFHIDCYTKRDN
jgi:DNA-directed RNA polymerase subunit H (RpoH/RPB5)